MKLKERDQEKDRVIALELGVLVGDARPHKAMYEVYIIVRDEQFMPGLVDMSCEVVSNVTAVTCKLITIVTTVGFLTSCTCFPTKTLNTE